MYKLRDVKLIGFKVIKMAHRMKVIGKQPEFDLRVPTVTRVA